MLQRGAGGAGGAGGAARDSRLMDDGCSIGVEEL